MEDSIFLLKLNNAFNIHLNMKYEILNKNDIKHLTISTPNSQLLTPNS